MGLALCILAGGVVAVALVIVIKCPGNQMVALAEALSHWISGAPKPPALLSRPPAIKVEITPAPMPEAETEVPGQISPP